jgi:hypothetical protein
MLDLEIKMKMVALHFYLYTNLPAENTDAISGGNV